MKIGIYTDVHYCSTSSIVRSRGDKYSSRIENCINSVNWAEDLFAQNKCDTIVCLGDFFDKNTLTAEEIRGVNELKFAENINHYFLVGNHEISKYDCTTSSMHLFNSFPFITVVDSPTTIFTNDTEICFIPYTIEEERKSIGELFNRNMGKRLVLSHNDIKGLRYGAYVSEEGLDIEDISHNCNMFINGHLHNGQFLNNEGTILNLGNLTGQNFGEDAFKYKHLVCILDTDTMKIEFFENPYAYNFYKLEMSKDLSPGIGSNAVVSIKTKESLLDDCKNLLVKYNVTHYRILIEPDDAVAAIDNVELLTVDHLKLLNDFVIEKLGATSVVQEELSKLMEVK